jgi:mannose-6-phosphate isomerase-like protein (cupin superfamily)
MSIEEILSSGLLEMYCLGIVSDAERELVQQYALQYPVVNAELQAIEKTIGAYGVSLKKPAEKVKQDIFNHIYNEEAKKLGLPGILSPSSTIEEWLTYMQQNVMKPTGDEPLYMMEVANTKNIVTYFAWAKPGAFVEEEHSEELERLFMLQGSCKIDIQGITHYYKAGDFVEIKKNTLHRAEATGRETMILVGQRFAA